jgi:murein DD-endopeptidase MepM/ murein hydrolase activator NlpD
MTVRMRYAVAFLIGFTLGALALFLYLQTTGRMVPAEMRTDRQTPESPQHPGRLPLPAGPVSSPARESVPPPAAAVVAPPVVLPSGLIIPVVGVEEGALRDDFHDRRGGGRAHQALDIPAPMGTPVVAADHGTIRKLHLSAPGGITIYQFNTDETLVYYYAHLQRYAPGVIEGKKVVQGEVIGYVGVSGNAPPGTPHLHFSIARLPPTKEWWKGDPVNPYPLLKGSTSR